MDQGSIYGSEHLSRPIPVAPDGKAYISRCKMKIGTSTIDQILSNPAEVDKRLSQRSEIPGRSGCERKCTYLAARGRTDGSQVLEPLSQLSRKNGNPGHLWRSRESLYMAGWKKSCVWLRWSRAGLTELLEVRRPERDGHDSMFRWAILGTVHARDRTTINRG